MTIRPMPPVDFSVRPGVRSDVSQKALSHWFPDLKAQDDDETATISIVDMIGKDVYADGVTVKRIAGALRSIGSRPVTVTINSPGGDIFEGLAIYNLLREHDAEVTVKVVGLAASAASVIAMAGDRVEIARSGFFMIHNSWVIAMGNKEDLREIAGWLGKIDDAMAGIYGARVDLDRDEIVARMVKETWISGDQAVDLGFADDFLPRDQVVVHSDDPAASAVRAERCFDLIAAKAGISRRQGRELLAKLKMGGKSGAAPTGGPDSVDVAAELHDIRKILKNH